MLVTDPREPPAARAPEPGRDLVVEHVDDPRFALLTAREPSEHGLRIDPATGQVPPSPPVPQQAPAVVRAPARDRVARDRRRAGRLAIAALMLPIVVAAVIGVVLWLQGDSGGSAPAPAVSRRPPAFTVSTTVAATAPAAHGIAVAAAGNGGLWYQESGGSVTRLAATDGSVNYTFASVRPALGMAVSGGSLMLLVNGPAGAELVFRDRGSGKVQSRLPLPGAAGCSTSATSCAPLVANGQIWAPLAGGVARIDNGRATLTPVTGVLAIAGSGLRHGRRRRRDLAGDRGPGRPRARPIGEPAGRRRDHAAGPERAALDPPRPAVVGARGRRPRFLYPHRPGHVRLVTDGISPHPAFPVAPSHVVSDPASIEEARVGHSREAVHPAGRQGQGDRSWALHRRPEHDRHAPGEVPLLRPRPRPHHAD